MNEARTHSNAVYDDMFECLDRIEKGIANLEVANNNGGLPEDLDEAEVSKWREETLRRTSEKLKVASLDSGRV